ncbi:hypothetical protein Aam_139_007 [Acidocella aminolytica 101 = DSM 11237]|uniref:Uncharacterized protein n=1 Tax=Acidocella aminolytica 101 = DSM 11237 TaxID=1120923 RepID=A0A0D6PJR5_9PROT|nr:hypothetical protein [Acidocella aminolytica]GAN82005.1 hypothetical protein Aam_139_007 [Acidocella aminolytica 101 = DSM 11237]GBQ44209.1 hypothetical protein AA11237_3486 [Acidocella aminolytica 101 = DSM 11237]
MEREIFGQPAEIRRAERQQHTCLNVEAFTICAEAQPPRIPSKDDLAKRHDQATVA